MSEVTTSGIDIAGPGQLFESLHTALQQQRIAQQQAYDAIERQLQHLRDGVDARLNDSSMQDQLVELRTAKDALEAEQAEFKRAAETAATALETERARVSELEQQVAKAAAAEAKANEKHSGDQAELRAEAERLQQEANTLQGRLEEASARENVLKQSLDEAEHQRVTLQKKLDAAPTQDELRAVQEELREERARAAGLEDQLQAENARGTKAVLASQLAEALQESEKANEEVRRLRRQLEDAQSRQSEAVAPQDNSDELVKLHREVDSLRAKLAAAPVFEALPGASPADDGSRKNNEADRVREVIARQANGSKRTLGEILVEAGILTQAQVNECLDHQKKNPHQHIGTILVEKKLSSEEAVAYALAYQCGVEYVRLDGQQIDGDAVALLNERLAQKHVCVPIASNGDTLQLAMSNPVDLVAIEDIERATGRKVEVLVSTEAEIKAAIAKHYA